MLEDVSRSPSFVESKRQVLQPTNNKTRCAAHVELLGEQREEQHQSDRLAWMQANKHKSELVGIIFFNWK